MSQRHAQFGLLVTAALPKDAKSRGFAVTERGGIIIITTADLAPAIALVLYELVLSLDKLSDKAQTLQTLLQSRELVECVTNNLSLVQPLQNIIKTMDKAHVDVTTTANSIINAIQRNNAKLAEHLQNEAKPQ
jgi:3-oxoacyl-(acyl-carrier-protein) synthase